MGGRTWSLIEIEKYVYNPPSLDNIPRDPRAYIATSNGAISGGNLRPEAYRSEDLDFQFTDSFNNFMNNSKKGLFVDRAANTVVLSSIFAW
jgi:hypothetical protein